MASTENNHFSVVPVSYLVLFFYIFVSCFPVGGVGVRLATAQRFETLIFMLKVGLLLVSYATPLKRSAPAAGDRCD